MTWETVIGLEVHAQLKTQSKLFSGSATAFGAPPNTQTSFVDAGFPGVLPVLNREAIMMAIVFGLAIEADINDLSYFERKNYFYPDLPKGYQISQFQKPIISNGHLPVRLDDGRLKNIKIVRAHLEEDAGKSLHENHSFYTGVDLNRSGTTLLEIVTAPCLYSAKEAIAYLKSLRELLQFIGICNGNMQEGSFRCDVNISHRRHNSKQLGTRVELKNLNSFRSIEKAICYETTRQTALLEALQSIHQETRLYSADKDATYPMRSKEQEVDYRYFPDPDLLPVKITVDDISQAKQHMPELPLTIRQRLHSEHQLPEVDIEFLLSSPATIQYFDALMHTTKASAKLSVNWLKGPYAAALNASGISFSSPPVSAIDLAKLLDLLHEKKMAHNKAKEIFNTSISGGQPIERLIHSYRLTQPLTEKEVTTIIHELIKQFPKQVEDYRAGKEKLLAFFVGQVMKQTKGKADPAIVNDLLRHALSNIIDKA